MRIRRLLHGRRGSLFVTGLSTACVMLAYEATKQALHPTLNIWSSHFLTIGFTTGLAVALRFVLQQQEERSRRELSAASQARQRAEAELRQSENRMGMAIEAARIGFFDWDTIRDEQVWSSTAKQLLGLSPESPANLTVLMNAVHAEDREPLRNSIASVTPQKPDFVHEHRACWRDGTVHWIWVKGRGFFDQQERLVKISGIAMDIDERKRAEEGLRLLATALEEAPNAIVLTDHQGTILWVNPAFTEMTGYTADEAIGKNPGLWRSDEQDAGFYAALWNTIAAGTVWRGEVVNRKKDGSLYTEEMTVAPVRSAAGAVSHYVAIKQDITQRKLAEQALQDAEQKYRSIFENAVLGIFQTNLEGDFVSVNPALARLGGYDSPEDFLNHVPGAAEIYVDLKRRDELRELLLAQKVVRDFEVEVKTKDGAKRTTSINVGAVADSEGKIFYLEGTVQDITERKAAEARVQFLAYHDALTGLPNRVLFEDRLAKALANARRRQERVAVLWLDLDNFKTINDSLGHSVGDLLLKLVGERLHRHTRAQDTVAKVGGDEFVFALINPGHISHAAAAVERIRRVVAHAFEVQGRVLNVTCSIGISLFPDHGGDSETLLKNADQAMYCAKENGRNNFRFFTSELNDRAMERLTLENSLRVALANKELFLVYQPQLEIATGRITGGEALLRWRHPELGLVAPDRFIPIAENSGLIIPIGEWVLKTACTQARCWQDLGLPALPIAVNVSAVQLQQEHFLRLVRRVLEETGLAPQYLELELTEGVLFSNSGKALAVLQELAGMGLPLSIDDFGAGYSSLSYLQDLPVCKLKIDRSFMRAMTVNPRDAAITAAVISMGHSLNLKVLAEGVETEEQMSFLRAHGCDEIQGFYFSQPLEADAFAEKVRTSWRQPDLPRFASKLLPAT
jgi:diguanylate cyclase (GGDEF)-like protein/PAS domain S-box-containing protein